MIDSTLIDNNSKKNYFSKNLGGDLIEDSNIKLNMNNEKTDYTNKKDKKSFFNNDLGGDFNDDWLNVCKFVELCIL